MVTTARGVHYEPVVLRDLTAMMEKMPPLHKGGKAWLSKFLALMSGQSCALGDIRQMLAGACSLVQIEALEEAAGTSQLGGDTPLPHVAAQLFQQIKLTFPQPTDLAPAMFPYDHKTSPAQHYLACVENWIESTGKHPGLSAEAETLFRTAIIDGLPSEVKKTLMSDPDILVCPEQRFKRHLMHHCRAFAEEQAKNESEENNLAKQLLKMQLAKMHGEAKAEKNKKKEVQMFQTPVAAGRGRGQFRGGYRGRGGNTLPQQRGFYPQGTCFLCGDPNHWVRECPNNPNGGSHFASRGRGTHLPPRPIPPSGPVQPGGNRPWQVPQQPGAQPQGGQYYQSINQWDGQYE